jgi:hypothetical protein
MPDLDQIKQGEQVSARPARGRSLKPPTIEDGVRAGGFLAGRPEDIIEQLKAVEKRYPGLDRVICATPLGTPLDVQLADLDRFAKEVIPASATPEPPPRRSRPEGQPRATATRPPPPSVNFLVTQRTLVDGGNSHVSALGS